MRVVIDSGVVVSAALSEHGAPATLLRLWTEGEFEIVVSPQLVAELQDVLARPQIAPRIPPNRARALVRALSAGAIEEIDPPTSAPVTRGPKDEYLVALARAAGADVIVSGDRHLLELDIRPPVLTPRELLQLLRPS